MSFRLRGWGSAVGLPLMLLVTIALAGLASHTLVPGNDDEVLEVQVGLASFYGPGFHGKETASGEIFDQRDMTAAHRTLPLGSVVRIINLENDREVILRITDRGPYGANYRRGTIIDVSKGAAQELGFVRDGVVRVRLEVIDMPAAE